MKIFLNNCKRLYNIIFETRKIEEIQEDYYNHLWISKAEQIRLHEYEKEMMAIEILRLKDDYNHLLDGFKLATHRNYLEMR